jgi:hypothetical protein
MPSSRIVTTNYLFLMENSNYKCCGYAMSCYKQNNVIIKLQKIKLWSILCHILLKGNWQMSRRNLNVDCWHFLEAFGLYKLRAMRYTLKVLVTYCTVYRFTCTALHIWSMVKSINYGSRTEKNYFIFRSTNSKTDFIWCICTI